jgi:hypothetical protein
MYTLRFVLANDNNEKIWLQQDYDTIDELYIAANKVYDMFKERARCYGIKGEEEAFIAPGRPPEAWSFT